MNNDIITTQRLGHNEVKKKTDLFFMSLCLCRSVVMFRLWKVKTSVNTLRHTCNNKTKNQSERVKNYRT